MGDGADISRRRFLSGQTLGEALRSVGAELADALAPGGSGPAPVGRHGAFPILRPPRAVTEALFLAGCTRCRACLEACPHDAIVPAPARFRAAAESPMIDPMRQPCLMCEDTPCVAACEPGVLRPELPVRMGTARINVVTCMAHQGGFCTVCSEHCPVPGAIELDSGKPTIDANVCTGCGVCQYVCPAPDNAVLLTPAEERPNPSGAVEWPTGVEDGTALTLPPRARVKPLAPWEHDLELVADPFEARSATPGREEPSQARGTPGAPRRGASRGA